MQSSCCFAQRRSDNERALDSSSCPQDAIFFIEIAPEVGCRMPLFFCSVSFVAKKLSPPSRENKKPISYEVSASVQGPQQASKGHRVFPVAFCPMCCRAG